MHGRSAVPQQLMVTADHQASYDDPIAFAAGEPVTVTDRTDVWDGHRWLWARAADGREGWIPDDLVETRLGVSVGLKDYDARELSCRAGEPLTGLASTHGWTWCRNASGELGWVPSRNLRSA
ncbi:MAG: SH3 domain-containing protein [Pseudomonadota bacterium]